MAQPKIPKGKKAVKSQKSGCGANKKGRRKAIKETYSPFIYRVLKQVHPDKGISSKAMSIMNSFIIDIFKRIAGEASNLLQYSNKSTLSSWDIQSSVKLILPGNLAKLAIHEGTKAVKRYENSK